METNKNVLDDKQTTRKQAHSLLETLRADGFSGDTQKLALALGRDENELNEMLDGKADIDEDLLMKIRGIAEQRNLKIE
ncbi:MAG: hypothetical protein ACR2N3_02770 [Pyrinomonadaceae bacterium]